MSDRPKPEEIERIRNHMAARIAMSTEGMTDSDKERFTLLAEIDWQAARIKELQAALLAERPVEMGGNYVPGGVDPRRPVP